MKVFMQKQLRGLKYLYIRVYRIVRPYWAYLQRWYQQVKHYYKTNPKARKRTLIVGPPAFFFFVLLLVVWIETPSRRELRNIQNQVASEIYAADSVLLGRYYIQDRTEVAYEEISPAVIEALISTEDIRFYDHRGVDYMSLGRVLVKSIFLQDESSGGGSTITQQLSKNLYPRKRYWILSMLINKLREVITARRLEMIYSKQEIITLYLNTVPFADNTFGIEAASQRFYSTSAIRLSIDQAAVLVGMLKATTYYNPRLFPERAQKRRNVVFAQMVKNNALEKKEFDSLKLLPLDLQYNKISHHQGLAPYFREYLKAALMEWCKNNPKPDGGAYNIYTDGLKIYTTLDSRLQAYAEKAVTQQMAELQKQFFDHWGKQKPWHGREEVLDEAIHRSNRYKALAEQKMSEEEIMAALQKPIPMKLFTWQGVEEAVVSPIDSIIHHLQYLNAGFLAMEPSTGKIIAWVGGIDHDFFQYDHVKESTKRQVGSIFKPIVYAEAIEKGASPCELIGASQQTYIDKEGDKWTPRNTQNDYNVEYTMRGALAYSVNTVAVKVIVDQAGVENTMALARKMGVTSEMPDVPSIALGASSLSLMEMTTAYACLANDGVTNSPYYINSIKDLDGNLYKNFKPESGTRALSTETAQIMKQLLRTVVHEGTASRVRWRYGVYTDIAGKTGTTQQNADGWFMAFTPYLAIGTWVGADDPRIRFRSTKLGQGSNSALPITGYFLKYVNDDPAFKGLSNQKFTSLPKELSEKLDCDLYELNELVIEQAKHLTHLRDSVTLADTLATPPEESFLEMLYRRKLKIEADAKLRDSISNVNAVLEMEGG